MALGAAIPVLFMIEWTQLTRSIMLGAGVIVIFGFIDDLKNLSYKKKFLAQIAAASIVVFQGGVMITSFGMLLPQGIVIPDIIAIPLTMVVIVGVTNAINLADGLDGLAGGISLLTFLCIAFLAYQGDNFEIPLIALAMSGATLGFLRFNTFPATIFMGDTGSQLLGFLAVTLSLSLTQTNTPLSPVLPLLLIGFPILDTLTVMSERIIKKKSPFIADKNHFHHKFMRLGFYHTEAVFVIYLLQTLLITSAYALRFSSDWLLLIFYGIFSGIILVGFWYTDFTDWQFTRTDLLDKLIKGNLKTLKEKSILIKFSFQSLRISVSALLLFSCFLPVQIHQNVVWINSALLLTLIAIAFVRKSWLSHIIRISLLLLIPMTMYQSEIMSPAWFDDNLKRGYNIIIVLLVVFSILTLKFTRRQQGFKTSPLDFLILFIALVIPNLPDPQIQSYHMGFLATKTIIFFFSFEVLMGELRNDYRCIAFITGASLFVISLRGLIG